MIKKNPTPAMTNTELESWFAAAGLTVSVVERCPVATCPSCATSLADPLAEAA